MNFNRKKFNIALLGGTKVGKTSIIEFLLWKPFNESKLATIGIDTFKQRTIFDGKEYIFKIFDTAGSERYNSVASSVIKIVDGYLLVFSYDRKDTIDTIRKWIDKIEDNCNRKEKVLILVGNKNDLYKREITYEERV